MNAIRRRLVRAMGSPSAVEGAAEPAIKPAMEPVVDGVEAPAELAIAPTIEPAIDTPYPHWLIQVAWTEEGREVSSCTSPIATREELDKSLVVMRANCAEMRWLVARGARVTGVLKVAKKEAVQ